MELNLFVCISESPQVPTVNLVSTEQTVITLNVEQKGKKKAPPTRKCLLSVHFEISVPQFFFQIVHYGVKKKCMYVYMCALHTPAGICCPDVYLISFENRISRYKTERNMTFLTTHMLRGFFSSELLSDRIVSRVRF